MLAFEPKTETVVIDGKTVLVHQIRARDVVTLNAATTDAERAFFWIAAATEVDGAVSTPVEVSQWPQIVVNKLLPIVMRVNGYGADAEAEAPAEGNAQPRRKTG